MNKPWSQPVCCHNLKVGTAVWEIHHQLYGTAQNHQQPTGEIQLVEKQNIILFSFGFMYTSLSTLLYTW